MSECLVIIPTYNEIENVALIIAAVQDLNKGYHVLIVDDNSPDGTGDLADQIAQEDERIFVLHRTQKAGLGKAYLAGFKWGLDRDYDLFFEMDADLSHPADALPRFIEAIDQADVVLGSRWVKGGGVVGWPLKRRLISKGGSLYARLILGVPIRDVTGGFKCFRRSVLEEIELDQVATVGYGFQIELTWKALKKGFKVVEVPILFTDRIAGESKMSTQIFLEALSLVWKLRLGLIR